MKCTPQQYVVLQRRQPQKTRDSQRSPLTLAPRAPVRLSQLPAADPVPTKQGKAEPHMIYSKRFGNLVNPTLNGPSATVHVRCDTPKRTSTLTPDPGPYAICGAVCGPIRRCV